MPYLPLLMGEASGAWPTGLAKLGGGDAKNSVSQPIHDKPPHLSLLSPPQKPQAYSPHQPGRDGVVTINCPVTVGRPLHRRKEAGLGDGFVAAMSPWETPFARNPGVPRRILSRYFYYFEAESVSGHHHRPKTGSGDAVWLRGVPGRQIRSSGAN